MQRFRRGDDASGTKRMQNHSSSQNQIVFNLSKVEAHKDQALELDVGPHKMSLKVKINYRPFWDGLGPQPEDLNKVCVNVLMSRTPLRRPCDAHYQEEVPLSRCGEATLCFGSCSSTVFLWLYASLPISDVSVTCQLGHKVEPYEDLAHPWRISRMYNVDTEVFDDVLDWLTLHRTQLKLKTVRLIKDEVPELGQGTTPLHLLMENCGDPKLAKFYLSNCFRYINSEARDKLDQTALCKLVQRRDIDMNSPLYMRALALAELFVKEAAVSTDLEDHLGNSLVHYAARTHRFGSKLLPLLVNHGAPPNIKNKAGRKALEEASLEEYGLLPIDLLEVEKIVSVTQQYDLPKRTLKQVDQVPIPMRDQMHNLSDGSGQANSVPTLVKTGDDGLPGVKQSFGSFGGGLVDSSAGVGKKKVTMGTSTMDGGVLAGGGGEGGVEVDEEKMRDLFEKFDVNHDGYLHRNEMRAVYSSFHQFGVEQSTAEIDRVVAAAPDGKVSYEQFCVLMLRLNSR